MFLFRKKPKQLQLALPDEAADGRLGRLNRWAIVVIGGALATAIGTAMIGVIKPTPKSRALDGALVLTKGASVWMLGANGAGGAVSITPPQRALTGPIVDFQTGHVARFSSPPQGLYYSVPHHAFIAATGMEAAVSRRSFRVDSRLALYSDVGKPKARLRSSRRFSFSAPIVSPDGTQIAYEKTTYSIAPHVVNGGPGLVSGPASLWVGPTRGCCDKRVLTNLQGWLLAGRSAWSPDGRYIASGCAVPHNNHALCIVDLAKRRISTPALLGGNPSNPAWDPHGLKLAYIGARGGLSPDQEIYTYDLGRKRTVQLTDDAFGKTGVAWSPSGREIAYVGAAGVRVISASRPNVMLGILVRGDFNAVQWVRPSEQGK